jgi:kinesin family member 2/24
VRVRPVIEVDKPLQAGQPAPVQRVAGKREAVLFMPRMNATGTLLDAYSVSVDGCFVGTNNDNDSVYEAVAPPLVHTALFGGATSIVCYGETGSGKTHTAFAFLRGFAQDLEPAMETHRLMLNVVELQQATVVDVLTNEVCQIVETEHGGIAFSGSQEPEMTSIGMLNKLLDVVYSQRNKHPKSAAKTHLLVRISLRNKRTSWAKSGSILVVDLAGAEKASDTEARHIGASFTALKDCVRIRAIQKANQTANEGSVPFRTTSLTYAMKDVLEVSTRATKIAMINCISPSFTHLRQSFETLRMATLCCVHPYSDASVFPVIPQFTFQDCADFCGTLSFGRIRNPAAILPEKYDGRVMLQQNEETFLQMFCGEAAQQRAAAYALQLQASPQGSPTLETQSSGAPPKVYAIPTRVAKSVFTMMQNIAIATKCLGPAGRTALKPRQIQARPDLSSGSSSGALSIATPQTPGGPPPGTNTSARKLPPASTAPRKGSAAAGSVVTLPAIKSAQASPRVPPVQGR